jgi:hypothetical protein
LKRQPGPHVGRQYALGNWRYRPNATAGRLNATVRYVAEADNKFVSLTCWVRPEAVIHRPDQFDVALATFPWQDVIKIIPVETGCNCCLSWIFIVRVSRLGSARRSRMRVVGESSPMLISRPPCLPADPVRRGNN